MGDKIETERCRNEMKARELTRRDALPIRVLAECSLVKHQ